MKDKLNTETAIVHSLDLTKIALENKLIPYAHDPKESAKNVIEYYETLCKGFTTDSEEEE